MNDSTKRAIRTFVQAVVGAAAAIAVAVPLLPAGGQRYAAIVAGAALVAATISKVWAALQAAGKIPPWLLDHDPAGLKAAEYEQAWHAGHRAATAADPARRDEALRLAQQDELVRSQIRRVTGQRAGEPVLPADVTQVTAPVEDTPGRHSPEATGQSPTSIRSAATAAGWRATAPAARPVYPEVDPRQVLRDIDGQNGASA